MRAAVFISLLVLSLAGAPRAAHACKRMGPFAFEITGQDSGPAGQVTYLTAALERGTPGDLVPGNCSNFGRLVLRVSSDGSPDVGFYLQLVDGRLPDGLTLPVGPVALDGHGQIRMEWTDLAVVQKPIDFTLALVPVNAAGVTGEPSPPVRVEGNADFVWWVFILLFWPLALFLRHAADRLPLDYHTTHLPDGGQARPEREWLVAPGRLGRWHHRAGVALHMLLVLAAAFAAMWFLGYFGVLTLFATAVALHLHGRRVDRRHPALLPLAGWFLRQMVRRHIRHAGTTLTIEAALTQQAGTPVRVRGRVRCREGGACRREDVRGDSGTQIHEWQVPFELVDERGGVLAIDVARLWVVARTRVDHGDEVTLTGVIERRPRGIGHGAHPYSGTLVAVTLAAPAGGALRLE